MFVIHVFLGASRILPPFNFQKVFQMKKKKKSANILILIVFPSFFLCFKWINEHKDMLQPPVNAKLLFEESMFIIMVVGGPNRRTDYHVNMTEEFFYQVKGKTKGKKL